MRLKTSIMTMSCLVAFASPARADDFEVLKPAVEETQADVAAMSQMVQSLGNDSDSGNPSQPQQPSNPSSGSDCEFCDAAGVQDENNVNQALGILQEVSGSLFNAMEHILRLPQTKGQDYNFNKSFACSFMGDAAIDIGSASLALGFPRNTKDQWKAKEASSVNRLYRARDLAFCP